MDQVKKFWFRIKNLGRQGTNKELVFPIKFDKCPVCGSTERVAEIAGDELKAAGRMSKDSRIVMFATNTPIVDATRLLSHVMAPTLISLYDVCANPKCGNFYCIEIYQTMTMVDVQAQQNPPGMPNTN